VAGRPCARPVAQQVGCLCGIVRIDALFGLKDETVAFVEINAPYAGGSISVVKRDGTLEDIIADAPGICRLRPLKAQQAAELL